MKLLGEGELTGSVEFKAAKNKRSTARRIGAQVLRYGGAAIVGGIAALGANNLYGDHATVGPLHVTTHVTVGEAIAGISSDFLDLRQDLDSQLPVGGYADIDGTSTDAMSPEDIVKSAAIIGDPKAVGEQLVDDYVHQAELAAAIGGAAGIATLGLLEWGALDKKRRNKVYLSLAGGVLAANAVAGYAPTHSFNRIPWQPASFSVGGHQVNVSYAGAGGGEIASEIAENEDYYTKIRDNMKKALQPIAAEDAKLRPDDERVTVYSDWHCNFGMPRVIRQVNDSLKVKTTLNVGDNFLGQTSIEAICADVLATNLKSTTNYVAPGNHDSDPLVKRMKDDGFKVLRGKTTTVDGATILGFADPNLSPAYSTSFSLRNPEVTDKVFTDKVTKEACEIQPDILLVHEPKEVSDEARDCADVTINGHTHVAKLPHYTGQENVSLNDGTVGGAAPNRQSIGGTLGKDATMYVLYINDGKPVGARLLTAHPDTSVNVSGFMSLIDYPTATTEHAPIPAAEEADK